MATDNKERRIELFYDGACPVCQRQVAFLKRRDTEGILCFTDITTPGFVPDGGKRYEALLARVHARLPDGTFVEGIEVFRRVYAALGYRRSAAISRWPGIRTLLDVAYRTFARHRPRRPESR